MIIDVTQEDISNSRKLIPKLEGAPRGSSCPVALALKRITKHEWLVGVHNAYPGLVEENSGIRLPSHVQEFIIQFDSNLTAEPISFEFPIDN